MENLDQRFKKAGKNMVQKYLSVAFIASISYSPISNFWNDRRDLSRFWLFLKEMYVHCFP